jgi:hypothetical protein
VNVTIGFGLSLLATVVLLAVVVRTGLRRQRGAHYASVVGFFAALGVSIWRAIAFGASGGGLHFEAAATAQLIHRIAVGFTFLLVPFLVGSGVKLARAKGEDEPAIRRAHRGLAFTFVVSFLVTSVLGVVMTWQAVAATG